jgi:hypothetical protein
MEKFEIATRKKYRYPFKGFVITTEDLWDLNMEQLNGIYMVLSKKSKDEAEESSLLAEKKADEDLANMLDIVKAVFTVKKEELEAARNAASKAKQKERLMEILAKKQDDSLNEKSEEEILKMIEDLG